MKKIILFLILLGAIALVYNDYTKRFEAKKVEKVHNQLIDLTTLEEKARKFEEKNAKISKLDTEGMKKIDEEERQLEEEAKTMFNQIDKLTATFEEKYNKLGSRPPRGFLLS